MVVMVEDRFFVVVLFGSRITATILVHPSISLILSPLLAKNRVYGEGANHR
jgi:hypothetical protein